MWKQLTHIQKRFKSAGRSEKLLCDVHRCWEGWTNRCVKNDARKASVPEQVEQNILNVAGLVFAPLLNPFCLVRLELRLISMFRWEKWEVTFSKPGQPLFWDSSMAALDRYRKGTRVNKLSLIIATLPFQLQHDLKYSPKNVGLIDAFTKTWVVSMPTQKCYGVVGFNLAYYCSRSRRRRPCAARRGFNFSVRQAVPAACWQTTLTWSCIDNSFLKKKSLENLLLWKTTLPCK